MQLGWGAVVETKTIGKTKQTTGVAPSYLWGVPSIPYHDQSPGHSHKRFSDHAVELFSSVGLSRNGLTCVCVFRHILQKCKKGCVKV